MRILLFGDVHEDLRLVPALEEELRAADLVVLHGDLTNKGDAERARAVIDAFRAHCGKVLAQPGNMDPAEASRYLVQEGISLDGRGYCFGPLGLFGVGGSNRTPFGTPTEYSEQEIEELVRAGFEEVRTAPLKMLVSHAPPRDTLVDRIGGGVHVGSTAVREFILGEQPAVCVSGHIHEARGEDRLGETRIFNTGLFSDGGYVAVVVDGVEIAAELRMVRE